MIASGHGRNDGRDDAVVRVEGVTRTFGRIQALSRVSLTLRAGTVHALVGPNGAGKSTLIRILMGLDSADEGEVVAPAAADGRLKIAYQPQVPALYDYLRVSEMLELAARIAGIASPAKCDEVIRLFGLSAAADQLVHTTSIGTRMKIALAAAIVQEPQLLILDEPTNAVDAIGVARLKERLRAMRSAGTTILLATHMIDFAQDLCDDVTVLLDGRVQYSGAVAAFGNPRDTLESRVLRLIDADVA